MKRLDVFTAQAVTLEQTCSQKDFNFQSPELKVFSKEQNRQEKLFQPLTRREGHCSDCHNATTLNKMSGKATKHNLIHNVC